ncbi:MAG: CoB--CoM heterodisulfide reductase iron-sulfur subunit B family protein [Dehalococcoidia bacterium]
MKYLYYPGCAMETTGVPIQMSIDAISKVLGIEFETLKDWTCCGCPGEAINELAAVSLAARNLALAEKSDMDLVAPCSCCYRNLLGAHIILSEDRKVRAQVKETLAAAGLEYKGTVKVRTLIDVLINDIGLELIRSKVKNQLTGLKVGAYYGCHQSRPYGPDHPEFPVWQDWIVESLGAESVFFPLKAQCCGGAQLFSQRGMVTELVARLLNNAELHGAQCIASTLCPLCFTNLDVNQGRIKSRSGANFTMPIVAISQLMGVAFGLPPRDLGLHKNVSPVDKVLAPYLQVRI